MLARQSPHFFTLVNAPSYKISDYLETVRKKMQKDKIDNTKVGGGVLFANSESSLIATEAPEQEGVNLEEPEEEESNDLEKSEQLSQDDKNAHKTSTASVENIEEIAPKIGSDWKKLGKKLGYTTDELLFFETEGKTPAGACKSMLTIWFSDDDDASLDNLAYILEGLELHGAADAVKSIIDPPNKMEDISD